MTDGTCKHCGALVGEPHRVGCKMLKSSLYDFPSMTPDNDAAKPATDEQNLEGSEGGTETSDKIVRT